MSAHSSLTSCQNIFSTKEYKDDVWAFFIELFLALGISNYGINSSRVYFMEKVNISLEGIKLTQVIKNYLKDVLLIKYAIFDE